MSSSQGVPVLRATGVAKSFGHIQALRGVDIEVYPGEVVGLVGDNGAGKSTLIKILSGSLAADRGAVSVGGVPVSIHTSKAARALGIETVYQDLALAPHLDAVANLYLGREECVSRPPWSRLHFLRGRAMRESAHEFLGRLGVSLPSLSVPVSTLSGGQRQGIAVARALIWATELVLMDEPTAALGVTQTEHVNQLIRATSERGIAVVVISHNIPELLEVADRLVVMRLGRVVADLPRQATTTTKIIAAMTGLDLPPAEGGGQ